MEKLLIWGTNNPNAFTALHAEAKAPTSSIATEFSKIISNLVVTLKKDK